MERSKHAINCEATEAVFAKYGGARKWLEACERKPQYEAESEFISTISMATLMRLNEQNLILNTEQEQVFEAIEKGINFGLYVFAYNFMRDSSPARVKVPEDDYLKALELWAVEEETYINSVLSREYVPTEFSESVANDEEPEQALAGYTMLIDSYTHDVCPDMDLQEGFIKGAKAAECVFICALRLVEKIEKKMIDDNFYKLIEGVI